LSKPFTPSEFNVPEKLETDLFRMRMLTINDVVKDYEAVMSSVDHLREVFGSYSDWPKGLTLEQNLIDLGWHQKEFQKRRSFAYTVVALDESKCVGCVYIDPPSKAGYDAEVYLWIRQSELGGSLEKILYDTVREWVGKEWPFKKVAYPGREIDWDAWEALPE
jgi:hypothetical protein